MAECTEKEGGEIAQFLREVTIVDEGMALDQNEENLAFEKLKAARADAEQFSTQLSRARTDAMRLARKQATHRSTSPADRWLESAKEPAETAIVFYPETQPVDVSELAVALADVALANQSSLCLLVKGITSRSILQQAYTIFRCVDTSCK